MRMIVAALVVACFVSSAHAGWSLEDRNRMVDQTNFIVADGCSGTLISVEYRLILTAYHCISRNVRSRTFDEVDEDGVVQKVTRQELTPVNVSQYSYSGHVQTGSAEYITDIVATMQNRDLALLQMRSETIPHTLEAPLLPEDMEVIRSETVWLIGNPLRMDASISSGTISSVTRTFRLPWANNQEVPLLQFDAAGDPGSSGGSLFIEKGDEGYLVAVTVAGGGKQMLGVPIETIREFLREHGWGDELLGDPVEEVEAASVHDD